MIKTDSLPPRWEYHLKKDCMMADQRAYLEWRVEQMESLMLKGNQKTVYLVIHLPMVGLRIELMDCCYLLGSYLGSSMVCTMTMDYEKADVMVVCLNLACTTAGGMV